MQRGVIADADFTLPPATDPAPDSSSTTDAEASREVSERIETSCSAGPQITQLPCVHCGQSTRVAQGHDPAKVFCCNGCLGAYQLIHGWGLEDFYSLRDNMKLTAAPLAAKQGIRFEQFDSVEFLGPSAPKEQSDGTHRAELAIQGLHCAACAWLIEKAARAQPGLLAAQVKMNQHTVLLVYDPGQTRLSEITKFFDQLGYQLSPFDPSKDTHLHSESRRQLVQIAIAGFLAANAMWLAVALYAQEFATVAAEHRYFMTLVGTALGLSSVAGPGRTFLKGALTAIKNRTPHMDLPIALGLSVGATVGTINAIRGTGDVYFDSVATLVFFLLIGRWIQFRQQQRAARTVDLLLRITPRHATLVRNGEQKSVLVDRLCAGDIILVGAGEAIAADGVVTSGITQLDRSLISGESVPVRATTGDAVLAGVINVASPIEVRVEATGNESRIGKVMQSVESAASEKTPIVLLADRIGGYFVISVLVLAVITFAFWAGSDLSAATLNSTALLIVACPCALALATPLAIAVSLGRAAGIGVLVRSGEAIQKLSGRGQIWLDKTGTLTEGKQRVTSFHGSTAALKLAAATEINCMHPVAKAIVEHANDRQLEYEDLTLDDTVVVAGGIIGHFAGNHDSARTGVEQANRTTVVVGNQQLVADQLNNSDKPTSHDVFGLDAAAPLRSAPVSSTSAKSAGKNNPLRKTDEPKSWRQLAEEMAANGESPILIAVNGSVAAILGISDPIRPDAAETIRRLKNLSWKVGILSGDHSTIVGHVAEKVGIDLAECTGDMTPEDKLAVIRRTMTNNNEPSENSNTKTVVMVGDGANDAAALAAADVGIAIRGGAEVSLQAAEVFVADGHLSRISDLIRGSRRTHRLIIAALSVSLGYNLFAVSLATLGWISPLVAAILMPLSSVSVLGLILAARTFPNKSIH